MIENAIILNVDLPQRQNWSEILKMITVDGWSWCWTLWRANALFIYSFAFHQIKMIVSHVHKYLIVIIKIRFLLNDVYFTKKPPDSLSIILINLYAKIPTTKTTRSSSWNGQNFVFGIRRITITSSLCHRIVSLCRILLFTQRYNNDDDNYEEE